MQTELVKRTCDFCGESQTYTKGNLTPEMERSIAEWITLAREFNVNGQTIPVIKHCCKEACATNLIRTHGIQLPPEFQKIN